MGRYATSSSISVLLPNWLSGNTVTSDAYGADIWSAAADRAEGEVNSSIVNRYDPTSWTTTGDPGIPPLVRKLTEDLACLFSVRAAQTQDSQIKNPNIAEWERSRQVLKDLRDGFEKLAYTDGSLVPTKSASKILSSTQGYSHIFALDAEVNWDVGQGEISDIESERSGGGVPAGGLGVEPLGSGPLGG